MHVSVRSCGSILTVTDQQREQRDVQLGERQIGEHKLGVKTGSGGTSQAPASTASTSVRAGLFTVAAAAAAHLTHVRRLHVFLSRSRQQTG